MVLSPYYHTRGKDARGCKGPERRGAKTLGAAPAARRRGTVAVANERFVLWAVDSLEKVYPATEPGAADRVVEAVVAVSP